jgi:hypothetical protein
MAINVTAWNLKSASNPIIPSHSQGSNDTAKVRVEANSCR